MFEKVIQNIPECDLFPYQYFEFRKVSRKEKRMFWKVTTSYHYLLPNQQPSMLTLISCFISNPPLVDSVRAILSSQCVIHEWPGPTLPLIRESVK